MRPWLRVRAVLDRVVALLLGLVAGPVLAVLAGAVRRDEDPAPALIRLARVGRAGRRLRVWKVRTMRSESEDGSAGGAALTQGADDPRVTPIGRVLRRYRIDELPQLLNVLTGDMALLGPRPESPDYVDDGALWREVLSVRPGIAGPTQLLIHEWEASAMGGADFDAVYRDEILPVKLEIDRWYVRHASPAIDVLVARSLLGQFLFRREPKALRRRVLRDVPAIADRLS